MSILVSVGTFVRGFDELVAAADAAADSLSLRGLAQIGHSSVVPKHLDSVRFLPEPTLRDLLRRTRVVVCHGGMGILGEAMRAGRPIIAVPRRGATTAGNPANDQAGFLERLAARYPIRVCPEPRELERHLLEVLDDVPAAVDYGLVSNVPRIIRGFLAAGAAGTG